MTGADVLFAVSSGIAVGSTLLAVTRRNPIYSAVWMAGSLFAIATIFLLLHATFLFVVQILLYAGAILVLFIFVIMLLNPGPKDLELDRPPGWVAPLAAIFALVLGVMLAGALYSEEIAKLPAFTAADARQPAPAFGTTRWFGATIYVRHMVAFEMISLLIMASIAAVVLLAKRTVGEGPERGDGARGPRTAAPAGRNETGLPQQVHEPRAAGAGAPAVVGGHR
jgi:NADH-quinone oxidoreductase subunit J